MKLRQTALAVSAALLLLAAPRLAQAEDGAPQDTKAKIKAKMEKILKLMKANEKALLELSANRDAKPRRVDVDLPPPDGSGAKGGEGGSSSAGTSAGEGASGEITKRLEELLKAQKESGSIPGELKQLVEMIPT